MSIDLAPPHADLTFMTPLSQQRADGLVTFLAEDLDGVVADIGCGWAELLLQVLAAAPRARGTGIDLDADSVEHGRLLARERGLAERVDLAIGDASESPTEPLDAAICVGASQIWGPPVEADQPLDYPAALGALRERLRPGARLVYGEGIWSKEPTSRATVHLAGRPDEFVRLAELLEIAVAAGFAPLRVQEASLDEWDAFESGYAACYARWLASHPAGHPDAAEVRARAQAQRAAYFGGYRGVLGLAYLCLVAV